MHPLSAQTDKRARVCLVKSISLVQVLQIGFLHGGEEKARASLCVVFLEHSHVLHER